MGLEAEKKQGQEASPLGRAVEPPERERNWEVWRTIEAGGKSAQVLERELKQKGINVSGPAQFLMRSKDFVTLRRPEQIKIACSTVGGLGFTEPSTTDQLFQRIDRDPELEYLPPEAAVALRLEYENQPLEGEWLFAGIKPLACYDGFRYIFKLNRAEDGLWLNVYRAIPHSYWDLGCEIVFRLRQ